MAPQFLDQLQLERERGITIKAQAVRLTYQAKDGREYRLHLIDTPGHVDFTYEVSRSLAACEGALLVVDATQGVEAQTLANLYLALEHDLTIVPVINKIDLPSADPVRATAELKEVGVDGEPLLVSAKLGTGIEALLEAIVARIPPPGGDEDSPLQALIFDSRFDTYKGVLVYVRVMNGRVRPGDRIRFMATGREFDVTEVGVFRPGLAPTDELAAGDVGYLAAAIRDVRDTRVGDTVTLAERPASTPLPGYRPAQPMVFSGLYPVDSDDYGRLKDALEKLQLNDAALVFEPETSAALGFGFRAGFLGLLHLEVVQERLEREFGLNLITTAPNVAVQVHLTDGSTLRVDNPAALPAPTRIASLEEPWVDAQIIVPTDYIGAVMELAQERRGEYRELTYLDPRRALVGYRLPLGEIMFDFFDQLKSRTRGYASFDYTFDGYRPSDLVRLDILLNGEPVDALSVIVHRSKAAQRGRALVEKLKELIPRQLFEVPVQAAIGGRVIARETVRALRKDVLAKCYGGDITRKRKLLEKQREGKRRMKAVGNVELPQEAFMAILRIDQS
jgi:GTP-binding protein LepA